MSKPFTDEEMSVLSELAYKSDVIKEGDSFDKVLNDPNIDKWLRKRLKKQYGPIIDNLKKKVNGKNYVVVKTKNIKSTGFGAISIKSPNNEVIVAARGTDGLTAVNDIVNGDAGLVFANGQTAQHKNMERFLDELQKKNYKGFYFTGHSLGGNLAMHGAIYMANTKKVKGVVTFNAPSFNSWYIAEHIFKISKIKSKVTQYMNEDDWVSDINVLGAITIGNIKIIGGNGKDKIGHGNSNNVIGKDGKFKTVSWKHTHILRDAGNGLKGMLSGVGSLNLGGGFLGIIGGLAFPGFARAFTEFLIRQLFGGMGSAVNPNIQINTGTMKHYASSLARVSSRSKSLDRRMNSLYWHLGIEWDTVINLGKLLRAGVLLDYAGRLDKCVRYLNDTASDFESAESQISNV